MTKRDDDLEDLAWRFTAAIKYTILQRWVLLSDKRYSVPALTELLSNRLGMTPKAVGNMTPGEVCNAMDRLLGESAKEGLNDTERAILEVLEAEPNVRMTIMQIAVKARKKWPDFPKDFANRLVGPKGKLRTRGLIGNDRGSGYFVTR